MVTLLIWLTFGLGIYAIAQQDVLYGIYAGLAAVMAIAVKSKSDDWEGLTKSVIKPFGSLVVGTTLMFAGLFAVGFVLFYAVEYKWFSIGGLFLLGMGLALKEKDSRPLLKDRLVLGLQYGFGFSVAAIVLVVALESCSSGSVGDYHYPGRRI